MMTCSKISLKLIKPHPLRSSVTRFFVIKIQVVCKDSDEDKSYCYANSFDGAISKVYHECEQ